jgi:hypothetical protein
VLKQILNLGDVIGPEEGCWLRQSSLFVGIQVLGLTSLDVSPHSPFFFYVLHAGTPLNFAIVRGYAERLIAKPSTWRGDGQDASLAI